MSFPDPINSDMFVVIHQESECKESSDFFKRYSERELEISPGYITGAYNLNIWYTDYIVLTPNIENY